MNTTTLATFRIDKKTWKKFKKWSADKDSNASKELNQFILRALGLIDENLETNIDSNLNNNLEQSIEIYLDTNLEQRIEKTVNNYLDINLDKRIYKTTLKYLDKEPEPDVDTNIENNIDISIDTNIDNNQVEELDVKLDTYIDKEEPLAESEQEQSNEQLTNAELARRMKVSPSTVSKWANRKSRPPKNLEWRYDPKLKKWVNKN